MNFFCRNDQDIIPATTTTHYEETSLATESTVVGETNCDEPVEGFQLAPGDSKAVLSIGATARTWGKQLNWIQDLPPLGLQIAHERKDKHKTPLIQRVHYHQKQIAKKLRNGRRKDPNFLKQMFFVPVFDGELLNQSVGYQSEALRYFEDMGHTRLLDAFSQEDEEEEGRRRRKRKRRKKKKTEKMEYVALASPKMRSMDERAEVVVSVKMRVSNDGADDNRPAP